MKRGNTKEDWSKELTDAAETQLKEDWSNLVESAETQQLADAAELQELLADAAEPTAAADAAEKTSAAEPTAGAESRGAHLFTLACLLWPPYALP